MSTFLEQLQAQIDRIETEVSYDASVRPSVIFNHVRQSGMETSVYSVGKGQDFKKALYGLNIAVERAVAEGLRAGNVSLAQTYLHSRQGYFKALLGRNPKEVPRHDESLREFMRSGGVIEVVTSTKFNPNNLAEKDLQKLKSLAREFGHPNKDDVRMFTVSQVQKVNESFDGQSFTIHDKGVGGSGKTLFVSFNQQSLGMSTKLVSVMCGDYFKNPDVNTFADDFFAYVDIDKAAIRNDYFNVFNLGMK